MLRVSNTIAPGRAAAGIGIGLANVRERLQVQFGDARQLYRRPGRRELWVAEIVMPLLRDGPEVTRTDAGRDALMEVIIVDDEPAARRSVRECCAREPDLNVVGEYGDARAALEAIRGKPPQLLFLDIQMDSMTGMELARALDPLTLPLIVFVTAYDHYALEAFEVSAVDYLLKPFDDARFKAMAARVRRRHAGGRQLRPARCAHAHCWSSWRAARAPAAETQPRVLAESGGRMHMLDVCAGGGGRGGPQLRAPGHRPRHLPRAQHAAAGGEVLPAASRCCASAARAWSTRST